ncbi:hypothetical protein [Hydrogenophaga sp.]|uniref:hypothetical protein n=1 Tax=Hydrogenophaga sp. TaxID=1904254 RepID=UPI003F6CDC78
MNLPLSSVARVGLLDRVSWSGSDATGSPLMLAQTDLGPVVVLSAQAFLDKVDTSPHPAWAIVLSAPAQPVLAFGVCAVDGFVVSDAYATVSTPATSAEHAIPS